MKKILALLGTCVLLCSSVSCSEQNQYLSSENLPSSPTASLISYKTADIKMADDFSEIITLDKRSNYILIFGKFQGETYGGYITNSQFTEKDDIKFIPQEGEIVKSAALMRTGKSAVMTCLNGNTLLYVFSAEANLENTINCGKITESDSYMTLIASDDGFYISSDLNEMFYISSGGECVENINTGGRIVCGIANDSEGEHSAEKTAEIIQNRAQIYLSEHYS